ncbi:MAG: NADH-quinone oxidoreductase subunit C [Candidatus Omnitrophica bacterium]|nr:NADH-quinone oxidoreductase subunit C [Candidatus Omnitrophota bacterium]
MGIDDSLNKIKDRFKEKVLKVYRHSDKRAYVDIDAKDIVDFTRYIFKDLSFRFNIASGVDALEGIEILYHFCLDAEGFVISIRVLLKDKSDPHIATITGVTRGAWWIEREIHELFGVEFDGNSDLRRLLLPDDWPDGVYPLRKDFVAPKRDSRKEEGHHES